MREYSWPKSVKREDGRVCETAEEYFCGPFFDEKGIIGFPVSSFFILNILGHFLYEELIPDRKLDDAVSFLEGEQKEMFLDLAEGMLVWHPNFRKTAGELAGHPFLQPEQTKA